MIRQIIITDLTRFKAGNPKVCTAGIVYETGECIRPIPYLNASECSRLKIRPGGILSGEFVLKRPLELPHVEDSSHGGLKFHGATSSETFREVLENSCFDSIEEGFEVQLPLGDRGVPVGHQVSRSIITIAVDPNEVDVMEDSFTPGKIKLSFTEKSGKRHSRFPITDLGFFDYAERHRDQGDLSDLNQWIHNQDEVFLRIGLGRAWQQPGGKNAYWMQANGIYTFPDAPPGVRNHA